MNTPHHSNHASDRDLESIGHALRGVDPQQPPELVDQAVLSRARRAVEARENARPWSFGWPHVLSTTAVIAIALSVLLHLRAENANREDTDIPGVAPQAAAAQSGFRREQDKARSAKSTRDLGSAGTKSLKQAAPMAAPGAAEATSSSEHDASRSKDPQAWLKELRRLKQSGDMQEFQRELERFRIEYPDFELPADLAGQ